MLELLDLPHGMPGTRPHPTFWELQAGAASPVLDSWFSLAAPERSEDDMATIICNITNLDGINGVRGLQNIVRTIASAASVYVVRGYHVVRWQAAHALAHATAKPAMATLPGVAPRMAELERARSWRRSSWRAGSLGSFASCPGRVDRG